MSDYLKPLPVKEVAAWYYRLAGSISKKNTGGRASCISFSQALVGESQERISF